MQPIPQLADFLTPADIEVRAAGFGYEAATAVVWLRDEWAGPGNPSTIRRGVALRAYLEGGEVGRTAIEGATELEEAQVQRTVARMQLDVMAAHGEQYLTPLRDEITKLGNPQHLIAKDDQLRDTFYRRVKEGHHSPHDLALITEVESKEKQLADARRRYATALWRYVAHLHRHGMTGQDIARWARLPLDVVQRRISSVSTAGAAAIIGIEQKTWSGYVARGQAPAPDDHVGREPVWHLSTVLGYIDTRPGRPGRPPKNA
ncbi:hypothetical protein AR457_42020 (plasmid) [Streptomyces agglomeratus]|uniref:hypothetical protein n=1 Tax=Streptomyces agglomeratus TaxID=285458 RepID=UPI0008543C95|nr:hypothetical protein [Streptomyces agglomeratus]OEJ20846.1 hypothetical protein AR457_42020 [Streptomyces agglomeratus]